MPHDVQCPSLRILIEPSRRIIFLQSKSALEGMPVNSFVAPRRRFDEFACVPSVIALKPNTPVTLQLMINATTIRNFSAPEFLLHQLSRLPTYPNSSAVP
jgi:hypothetical protein